MKWFNDPQTLEELKKQYKALAMEYHPDRGGNTSDMKAINAEYDELFAALRFTHEKADGTIYTQPKDFAETPDEFKHIIDTLIHLESVTIEIIGSWVWITGNTFKYRNMLKDMKFRYSKSKTAWYFHGNDYKKMSRQTFTLNEIRNLYGSEVVTSEPHLKLAIV